MLLYTTLMIKIKGYGQKMLGKNHYGSELKEVEITRIKNTATHRGACGYYGYVPNYLEVFKDCAPEGDTLRPREGSFWVHFIKSHQKSKIPMVLMGEEIEV